MRTSKTPSPLMFFGQYESYRDAASILIRNNPDQRASSFFSNLNPTYFLIGHSLECLFKSCLTPELLSDLFAKRAGHDLTILYERYLDVGGEVMNEDDKLLLDNLREHYHPGIEEDTVRYPLPGSKVFILPSSYLSMLTDLGNKIDPVMRKRQSEYMQGKQAQKYTSTING